MLASRIKIRAIRRASRSTTQPAPTSLRQAANLLNDDGGDPAAVFG